jgi:hypothetical protein
MAQVVELSSTTNEKTEQTSDQVIGGWEQFTKGFGSKVLSKMGFEVGKGLGKHNDGIPEPYTVDAKKTQLGYTTGNTLSFNF